VSGSPTAAVRRIVSVPTLSQWGAPVGVLVVWAVMAALNPRFLSPVNLTNLVLQIVAVGTIAVGVVLVLLIGEIDLSVGAVSGLGAAVVAVTSVHHGWPTLAALAAGFVVGALVGAIHGSLVTKVGIPSFVVTLGGLLGWQGALLLVLGDAGTVNLRDPALASIAGSFLPTAAGWALGAVVAAAAVAAALRAPVEDRRWLGTVTRGGVLAVGAVVVVAVFSADRGVPVAFVLFLVLLAVFDVVVRRTRLGRHAVAIGSDAIAARRAGIPVARVRMTVFVLASLLAVAGGVLAASRLLAVNQSSGSTDLMLGAIAAAVIGGTSLFGGRGSVWSALLGALVVGSVANGLDLMGVSSAARSVVTGLVLVAAVGADAVSRRRDVAAAP
jgi:D-xylose transport system permease protein